MMQRQSGLKQRDGYRIIMKRVPMLKEQVVHKNQQAPVCIFHTGARFAGNVVYIYPTLYYSIFFLTSMRNPSILSAPVWPGKAGTRTEVW